MIKGIKPQVWAFDAEWVPDPVAGRSLYGLSDIDSDADVMAEMWKRGGGTADNPQPFLKLALCRVVSIAAIVRRISEDGTPWIELLSLPRGVGGVASETEAQILERFLNGVGKNKPQLVGFNSVNSDLRIFVQRALIKGLSLPKFCARPEKPWEGVDYFAKDSDYHIDLFQVLTGWGRGASLHELATLSGIPGKLGQSGMDVPEMWLNGQLEEIIQYNEFDALTTYLLWLRVAHLAGFFDTTQYREEQILVEQLLSAASGDHLHRYLKEWERLRGSDTL